MVGYHKYIYRTYSILRTNTSKKYVTCAAAIGSSDEKESLNGGETSSGARAFPHSSVNLNAAPGKACHRFVGSIVDTVQSRRDDVGDRG